MKTYLVRLEATTEFVGLFMAETLRDLCDMVDECCTPADCEYTVLDRPIGLIDPNAEAPLLPARMNETEDGDIVSSVDQLCPRLALTDSLHHALHDETLEWELLDPMVEHPGSQIDALLSSPEGRNFYQQAMLGATRTVLGTP